MFLFCMKQIPFESTGIGLQFIETKRILKQLPERCALPYIIPVYLSLVERLKSSLFEKEKKSCQNGLLLWIINRYAIVCVGTLTTRLQLSPLYLLCHSCFLYCKRQKLGRAWEQGYRLPYKPIVNGEIDLHKQLSFVLDETHSVDAAR